MLLTIHKMLLRRYELDIKQHSSWSTSHSNCFGDFAGIALKLENVGVMFSRIHVHLCHPSREAV